GGTGENPRRAPGAEAWRQARRVRERAPREGEGGDAPACATRGQGRGRRRRRAHERIGEGSRDDRRVLGLPLPVLQAGAADVERDREAIWRQGPLRLPGLSARAAPSGRDEGG